MSDVVRIELIKLSYNESKKCITAKRVLRYDNGMKDEKLISDITVINSLLTSFSRQEKCSVGELINLGYIVVDKNKIKDDGVIVRDKAGDYHKFVLDKENSTFAETRLTRIERSDLGLMEEKPIEEDTVHEELPSSKGDEIIEESSEDLKETTDSTSSIASSDETSEDEEKKVDSTPTTVSSDGAIGVDEVASPVEEKEVAESGVTKETKTTKKKSIRNLRFTVRLLAVLTAGCVLVSGLLKANKDNTHDEGDKTQNPKYENDINNEEIDTSFKEEENEAVFISDDVYEPDKYADYGSAVSTEDMITQIQYINNDCFSYETHTFHNLVVDTDRQTLKIINDLRNETLNHNYEIYMLMNQYVNYILEGTTMFDGNVVKAFDYLTPYTQYIILVSAQSMLQLCPNYNYFTTYNEYDFNSLVNLFDDLINQTYRQLTSQSKVR